MSSGPQVSTLPSIAGHAARGGDLKNESAVSSSVSGGVETRCWAGAWAVSSEQTVSHGLLQSWSASAGSASSPESPSVPQHTCR
jgi:hypothetical protein